MRLRERAAPRRRTTRRFGVTAAYIPWTKSHSPPHLRAARRAQLKVGMKARRHTNINQIPAAFGQVLREERLRQSVSQEQLALYADVDRTFVSQIERGIRQPTLTTLFKLSRVLKLAPSVLVARMERSIKR
jgi:DNA-binding XRE family transcriptional regulator